MAGDRVHQAKHPRPPRDVGIARRVEFLMREGLLDPALLGREDLDASARVCGVDQDEPARDRRDRDEVAQVLRPQRELELPGACRRPGGGQPRPDRRDLGVEILDRAAAGLEFGGWDQPKRPLEVTVAGPEGGLNGLSGFGNSWPSRSCQRCTLFGVRLSVQRRARRARGRLDQPPERRELLGRDLLEARRARARPRSAQVRLLAGLDVDAVGVRESPRARA